MDEQSLDALPKEIAAGRLTVDAAAMKIMETIYTNPGRFGLSDMDEDARSDFLLEVLPRLSALLERHKESVAPFAAYLHASLPGFRRTWQKKIIEKTLEDRAMAPSVREIYEIAERKRMLAVAEPSSADSSGVRSDSLADGRLIFKRILGPQRKSLAPLEKVYRQRSALVLALKSAWYIDDEAADKVTGYCGCSKEYFLEQLERMRGLLQKKSRRAADLAEKRDRAWFFICKYRERLLHLEKGSRLYDETLKKLEYQIRSWKTKTRLLQSSTLRISPNNSELAACLEIPVHQVSIYLKYARDMQKRGETVDD